MKCFPVSLALLAFAWSHSVLAAEADAFAWPEGRKAAVSRAYDDALDSQLDNTIPALDRHGLKGSFYLQLSRDPVRLRLQEWRAAARSGHELGNHTLFHQCSASLKDRDWVEPQRDLDRTSAAAMRDQVLLANVHAHRFRRKDGTHHDRARGEVMAEGVDYIDSVRQEFVAIKLGDGAVTPDMWKLDPYAVTVETPVDVSGKQLIARVEEAARKGSMVNFTFHGVGGDFCRSRSRPMKSCCNTCRPIGTSIGWTPSST